jgi:predicted nucleic acid-binding protein
MRFVIDNSVVIAWCFQDQSNKYTEFVLESLETAQAFVPAIWPLEVGNVLLVAERRKLLSKASISRFMSLLRNMPIVVEQESPERMLVDIFTIAREHRLSTYDASYLDLAMRLGIPIATQDRSLTVAAKKCMVPLV